MISHGSDRLLIAVTRWLLAGKDGEPLPYETAERLWRDDGPPPLRLEPRERALIERAAREFERAR